MKGLGMDSSLFFFVLALGMLWLILDQIYGHKYISQVVGSLIPVLGK